jgi:hypothetical protein
MRKLSPYVGKLFNQQGHSHIRWFLLLAREYNLYNDEKEYSNYENMNSKFIINTYIKSLLLRYRECIKTHFIIKTLKKGILFRSWNDVNFYIKKSNNIEYIIEENHTSNLKIVYNNLDFFNIKL